MVQFSLLFFTLSFGITFHFEFEIRSGANISIVRLFNADDPTSSAKQRCTIKNEAKRFLASIKQFFFFACLFLQYFCYYLVFLLGHSHAMFCIVRNYLAKNCFHICHQINFSCLKDSRKCLLVEGFCLNLG